MRPTLLVIALALLGASALYLFLARGTAPAVVTPADPAVAEHVAGGANFVGRASCALCHEKETQRFTGSRHDLAMQPANEATVLGDFSDASFEHFGVRSTFFRRDGKYFARTDGADGALADFEIAYTFGVYPLQQYLIPLDGGRYQALSVAWDSRTKAEGGQRWFHLYPDEAIPAGDVLHWTGPAQNWNHMCAECHSTNLQKNWDADTKRYATSWSEIDVSCEACHGPGSAHVAWANSADADPRATKGARARGLAIDLRRPKIEWVMDPATGIGKPNVTPDSRTEVEMCARCHSRRSQLFEENVPGHPLQATHKPALLDELLYFVDGQQLDEVYEYGSFLQSRMHAVGVSCGDCHDPHSARIEGPVDDACNRCHLPQRFATAEHHHHAPGTKGASCVECHMPARNYMVVDARRDHSFRVPRPDLSVALGTPNACNSCHQDRDAVWARDAVAAWYPKGRSTKPDPATALDAGRRGLPHAEAALAALSDDKRVAGIVRATAIDLLANYSSPSSLPAIERALEDPDGLVRSAALDALSGVPPPERLRVAYALLGDPLRGVRIEAASALAEEAHFLNPAQRRSFDAALAEYRGAQQTNADRPESHANLGSIATRLGDRAAARKAYETGLAVGPWFAGLWINLADLEREEGREAECERVLRRGLLAAADKSAVHHALGLCLVRTQRLTEALGELKLARDLAPDDARFGFVYGVALITAGRQIDARDALTLALEKRPSDREILYALATLERDMGNLPRARQHAQRLFEVTNGDPGVRQLLEALR